MVMDICAEVFFLDVADFIKKRITELRLQKDVSERKMSLDLGKGENYIRNLSNGYFLPSYEVLGEIAEYFGLTLSEFFCEDEKSLQAWQAAKMLLELDNEDMQCVIGLIERFNNRRK